MRTWLLVALLSISGCGDDDGPAVDAGPGDTGPGVDAGPPDAQPWSLDHCELEPQAPTAGAGGTVGSSDIRAGAAEGILDLPVGSALGSYTARSRGLGPAVGVVDRRIAEISGAFNPSIGYETLMRIKVVVIGNDEDTIVLIKLDLGYPYEGLTVAVEEALGPEFDGKVLITASHSHSAWGHYSANEVYQLGSAQFRRMTFDRMVTQMTAVAQAALAARQPAMLGIHHEPAFDLDDVITRDRRGENNDLAGGSFDDRDLFVIRVDATDGSPIAMIPIFGMHGTIQDADNNLASTDAPGAVERALEEQFDEPFVVMHLQGTAGDVSPAGSGGVYCIDAENVCYNFARAETVGRYSVAPILAAYGAAGKVMTGATRIEMVTRSIPLGPDWDTFTVRGGELAYAPWDGETDADGEVIDAAGEIISPIDEFNAPAGAGLCGEDHTATFPQGQLPGTIGAYAECFDEEWEGHEPGYCVRPYASCMAVPEVAEAIEAATALPFTEYPVCQTAFTTISAFRIGDVMFASFPGEAVTLWSELVRDFSPIPGDTVILGYAHGEVGYLMTADDWLRGGYEPSINLWGPLEGEYIAEQSRALMAMAHSDTRENAAEGAAPVWVTPDIGNEIPPADPAPMAGMVPATIPDEVYVRHDITLPSAQPPDTIRRLESAHFVWIGNDPMAGSPMVTLEREVAGMPGTFEPVRRRSGRIVQDGDLLVMWTPQPLRRSDTMPRTHYWVAEWQAVTPWGTPGLDDVEDRIGVPLGRYRFHVEGPGGSFSVNSEPFDVVAGRFDVTAMRSGTRADATVHYQSADGWRLLDLVRNSNDPIPLTRGPVTVILTLPAGVMRTITDVPVTGAGMVSVDSPDVATATMITVRDRFGNEGSSAL
jgi:neutral ceramidase